jgi:acetyl-CoA acetyltransferase
VTCFDGGVVITGVGQSEIGRVVEKTALALTAESTLAAIQDAGLRVEDIDGVATYPGPDQSDPGYAGTGATELIDALGIQASWYLSAGETAGQLGAVMNACTAVAAGLAQHVVCFRTLTEGSAQGRMGRASISNLETKTSHWSEWNLPFGIRMPGLTALQVRRHMYQFGLTRRQLAEVALNARRNAALNPRAIYRAPMSMDDYLEARMISEPLCLYDCDVPVDASTAVVISSAPASRGLRRAPLVVEAVGCSIRGRYAMDQISTFDTAAHHSARAMWDRTTIRPTDVDIAELYDGFSYHTLMWLEALGFCDIGQSGSFVEGGERISREGALPINTQGGQLSGGRLHGFGFLHEACVQLWGDAGDRQVKSSPSVAAIAAGGLSFAGCMLLGRHM